MPLPHPQTKEYPADLVVVGAGTSGSICAISAARCGLRTILVEQTGVIGGVPSTTLMGSFANLMVNTESAPLTGGIILELMERLVRSGATPYDSVQQAILGKIGSPFTIPFIPALYEHVLVEMLEQADVQLFLNCTFLSGQTHANGNHLVFSSGEQQFCVNAAVVVDATGNASAAAALGAETTCLPTPSYGCLMRLGGVNIESTLTYIRTHKPWEAAPDFQAWIHRKKSSLKSAPKSLDHLADPVCYDHAPMHNRQDTRMNQGKWDYIEHRFNEEGVIYTLEMSLFRHLIRSAAERGDFTLFESTGTAQGITFNGDGIAYGAWGKGVTLCNLAKPYGFCAQDMQQTTQAALLSKKYNVMAFRFFKKYVPGFENSFLIDQGTQTVARACRIIYGCDDDDAFAYNSAFRQPIYLFGGIYEHQPGIPVPYGKIVPKNLKNVFAIGKSSSHGNTWRSQISCMSMGVAAAAATAVICREQCTSHTISAEQLRRQLHAMGVILETER